MVGDNDKGKTVFRPSPLQARQAAPAASPSVSDAQRAAVASAGMPGDDVPAPATAQRHMNPALHAAGQLLALLASVRSGRAKVDLPRLHTTATAAVETIDKALAGLYNDDILRRIRYALCATADDVALNLPESANDRAEWARRSLAVRFFGENIGGDRFWMLLDEMVARPAEYHDVLQLYHACLACGFEGRYRVIDSGRRAHQEIMQRVYRGLTATLPQPSADLSPHWRGQDAPAKKPGFWTPLALAITAALLGLLLIYIILRIILGLMGNPSYTALDQLIPEKANPLRLAREATAPPPSEGAQVLRLRQFLQPQIDAHQVVVLQDASTVRVRTTVGQLFKPGSDQLVNEQKDLFETIAKAVETEPGPVRIEGFSDSEKLRNTISFADNMALSKARAETAAAIVRSHLSDPSRVTAEGFGENQPVASNDTAEGKAQNRRVEVVIQRGGH